MCAIARRVQLVAGLGSIVGIALILSNCGHSEDRYLRREVDVEEAVGVWLMNPRVVEDLRDAGYRKVVDPYAHEIVLRPDGTCHFDTVLVRKTFERIDVECQWSLSPREDGRQTVDIDIPRGTGSADHTYYFFDENRLDGRLTLWRHVDDPDMWRYVEYAKVLRE